MSGGDDDNKPNATRVALLVASDPTGQANAVVHNVAELSAEDSTSTTTFRGVGRVCRGC